MPARPAGIAALVAAALVLAPVSAAVADPQDRKEQVDAAIDDLRGDLAETSAHLADAVVRLRSAQAQIPVAEQAVAEARGRLAAAEARHADLERRLAEARREVDQAERALAAVLAEIESSRDLVGGIAREAYQTGGMGELAVILEAESPEDFAGRMATVRSTLRSENRVLDDLAARRAEVAAKRADLEARRSEIADLEAEAAVLVERTAAAARAAEAAEAEVQRLAEQASTAAAEIEAEKSAEERRLAAMERESARLQAELVERARKAREAAAARAAAEAAAAKAKAAAERAASSAGRSARRAASSAAGAAADSLPRASSTASGRGFVAPVAGWLTSPYGMRTHPVTGVHKLHDGVDYGASCGTPVRAASSGEVIWATAKGGYGNQAAVEHGVVRGVHLVTSYSHLSGFAVRAGARVQRGEVIGYVGTTGLSTGCHLHFMVYEDGIPVNPMSWL